MLSIRLSRVGKKNKPMYRIAIMEKARDPYGRALEILGSYNPHSKELTAKIDRINHWVKNGAQMTPTVNNLLIEKGLMKGDKVKASIARKKKKGSDKAKDKKSSPERSTNKEEKAEDKPTETETPTEEAPKEETPVEPKAESAST